MTTKLAIACCAVGLAVGVGATWLVLRPADTPAGPRPAAAEHDGSRDRPLPVIERTGASAEDIRRFVAEEVRAALREHMAAPAPTAEPAGRSGPQVPDPTPAFEPAKDRIAQCIAQGAWTSIDRDWMHGVLSAVNRVERIELIRQVVVAANTGKLRLAVAGPPF
jgi:hypothetical protein